MQDSSGLLMPVAIAIIMFGIGLKLEYKDFKRVFVQPKAVLVGLFCQLVLLPLVAFVLVLAWPMEPVYKVGLLLIAACPGGTASNLVTHMLKGRVALSVSMTSFNSFLILFTIPIIINAATGLFLGQGNTVELSFWDTFKEIGLTVVLPVAMGVVLNELTSDEFTQRLHKPVRYILPAILLLVFTWVIFFQGGNGQSSELLKKYYLFFPALVLNLLTILIGYWVSGKLGINHRGQYTIGIEMGLQNSALAIFIATQILSSSEMSLIAVMYSSFSFFTTYGLAWWLKQKQ